MKVVINRCYGGFGLSPLAIREYLKRKGKECYFYEDDLSATRIYRRVEDPDGILFHTSTKDMGITASWEDISQYHFRVDIISRNDADLVTVVEELGEKADTRFSNLSVVKIPDGIAWEISEYDGLETVEEKHRSWY